MQNKSLIERRMMVALLFAALSVCGLFAKGNEQRLEGTVKSIGSDAVTIETAAHKVLNVRITSATKFLKGNKASSLSEMKTGDHVVFTAIPSATTSAETPSAANTHKDSLSLGLSFTAVQASY
ncbi:MAG TPA: hypothetical protein VFK06_22415 [Candidatus Angelobacter sp.]|nr:hypothetical protein [Candidatus Angelobacter sp.]